MASDGLTREEVLRFAASVQQEGEAPDFDSHQYDGADRELTWALDTLSMFDTSCDEIYSGTGLWALRFGKFTLAGDDQGFKVGVEHSTVAQAVYAMAECENEWGVDGDDK